MQLVKESFHFLLYSSALKVVNFSDVHKRRDAFSRVYPVYPYCASWNLSFWKLALQNFQVFWKFWIALLQVRGTLNAKSAPTELYIYSILSLTFTMIICKWSIVNIQTFSSMLTAKFTSELYIRLMEIEQNASFLMLFSWYMIMNSWIV